MKNHLLTTLLLFIVISGHTQTLSWLWADAYQESKGGYTNDLSTDVNNNVYVTGAFFDSILIFGNDTLVNPLDSATPGNTFVVKYGPAGNVLWARAATGSDNNSGTAVCADGKGNVYVIGSYASGIIVFGGDTIKASSTGNFFTRYDASGNVVWVKPIGSSANFYAVKPNALITDANGNIYVTGYFTGTNIIFGADTLTSSYTSGENGFIAKYDSSGNIVWAIAITGTNGFNVCNAITLDASGNIYVTGSFNSPDLTLGNITLTNNGAENIFTAKYDPTGNILWAKSAGGDENDLGNGIVTDATGNVYVAGNFSSHDLPFGRDTVINTASIGNYNVFLVKYTSSGGLAWVNTSEGNYYQSNQGISVDANGHIYLAGNFTSTNLDFVNYDLKNKDTTGSTTDIYLVQYDTSGNVGWAISAGGIGSDEVYGLSADTKGNLSIAGEFSSPTMVLGEDTLIDTASDNNIADIFVAKYGAPDTTGVQPIAASTQHITLYPNPTTGAFTLQTTNLINQPFIIYDMLGNKVYQDMITAEKQVVELKGLAAGNYMVNVAGRTLRLTLAL